MVPLSRPSGPKLRPSLSGQSLPGLSPGPNRPRPRVRVRRSVPVELAIAFALGGSLLAITGPAFVREVHASRMVEPVDGLRRLGASTVAYAQEHAVAQAGAGAQPPQPTPASQAFPTSAPLTPSAPPRGHCEADSPDTWDTATWNALAFRPVAPGTPHCFAFAFDSVLTPSRSTFRAHAHGDLDGDGVYSTFEITGRFSEGDARGAVIDPGMFVDAEVE
jgi:hypothetical protein